MMAGEAFVLKDRGVDDHLWVVLSDPAKDPEHVLIVSLTTLAPHKEQLCLVQGGDHPWVRHLSCVAYDFAKIVRDADLNQLKHTGRFDMQPPVSAALLERIRAGVANSTEIKMECADLLIQQGLLDC
jgi:hypothetical protein